MSSHKTEGSSRSQAPRLMVDMDSHTGLRGVAALWIVLFHCLVAVLHPIDMQGSSLMPLFFSLSGFSLAAVYGSRPWQPIRLLDLLLPCYKRKAFRDTKKPEGEGQAFDTRRFYYNRLTRLMPTYYLCLLLAIPLVFLGYHSSSPAAFLPNLFIGLLPIQSWCSAFFGWGLNEPAWFITTLLSFYLLFPYWLTRAQRQTDQQLARGLVAWYFFQLAILLAIFHGLQTPGYPWAPSTLASWHPLSRFPLFIMGINAGVLCLRHPNTEGDDLPWPSTLLLFFPSPKLSTMKGRGTACLSTADGKSLKVFLLTAVVATAHELAKAYRPQLLQHVATDTWLTGIIAFAQLEVVVALTRDGGQSLSSRFLRHPLLASLGRISAALYLVHVPMRGYVLFALNKGKTLTWPPQDCNGLTSTQLNDCIGQRLIFFVDRLLPCWAIPFVVLSSLLMATLINYAFEEPLRRWFREGPSSKPSGRESASDVREQHRVESRTSLPLLVVETKEGTTGIELVVEKQ